MRPMDIARAQQEVLIPHTAGGHTSLFILQQTATQNTTAVGQFQWLHRDSAVTGHRRPRFGNGTDPRERLLTAGWQGTGANANISNNTIADQSVARQGDGWTCGLHTIFNAWAYALGLELSGSVWIERYDEFVVSGTCLVRYAVCGLPSSGDIKAFFDCYGFVRQGQEIPDDRSFEETQALITEASLIAHAAPIRIREQLAAIDAAGGLPEGFPTGDTAAEDVLGLFRAAQMDVPDLTTSTGADLVLRFQQMVDIATNADRQSAQGAQTGGAQAEPTAAAPSNPQPQHEDTTSPHSPGYEPPTGSASDAHPAQAVSGTSAIEAMLSGLPQEMRPGTAEHAEHSRQRDQERQANSSATSPPPAESTSPTQPEPAPTGTSSLEALNARIPSEMRPGTAEHAEHTAQQRQQRAESLERALGFVQQAQTIQGISDTTEPTGTDGGEAPANDASTAVDDTVTAGDEDDSFDGLFDAEASFDDATLEDQPDPTPAPAPAPTAPDPSVRRPSTLQEFQRRVFSAGVNRIRTSRQDDSDDDSDDDDRERFARVPSLSPDYDAVRSRQAEWERSASPDDTVDQQLHNEFDNDEDDSYVPPGSTHIPGHPELDGVLDELSPRSAERLRRDIEIQDRELDVGGAAPQTQPSSDDTSAAPPTQTHEDTFEVGLELEEDDFNDDEDNAGGEEHDFDETFYEH